MSSISASTIGTHDHQVPRLSVQPVSHYSDNPDYSAIALDLYSHGRIPVPLRPRSSKPAVCLKRWADELSPESLRRYWRTYPGHWLGYIEEVSN